MAKFLIICGLLLANSGIIGRSRLRRVEATLAKWLSHLVSRRGYQDVVEWVSAAAEARASQIAGAFVFLWRVFNYLSAAMGALIVIAAMLVAFVPTLRQTFVIVFARNLGVISHLGIAVLVPIGLWILGILLSLLLRGVTFEPVQRFARGTFSHFRTELDDLKSLGDSLLALQERAFAALRTIEGRLTSRFLRYAVAAILRFLVLLITLILILPLGLLLQAWLLTWSFIYFVTEAAVVGLLVLLVSLLHFSAVVISTIIFCVALVLLFPYIVLERVKDTLRLESTFIALGIILSVVGMLLQ